MVTVRRKVAKKNLLLNLIPLAVGLFVGYGLSNFIPTVLLHYLLYWDIYSMLGVVVLSLIPIIMLVLFLLEAKRLGLSKRKARKTFFLGISISAFALGFWTFVNYPSILASDYSWLTEGINIYFVRQYVPTGKPFIDANLGALIFFIASILWDGFIGSFFAVLEHLLT